MGNSIIAFEIMDDRGECKLKVCSGQRDADAFEAALEKGGLKREKRILRKVSTDPDKWEPLARNSFVSWEMTY